METKAHPGQQRYQIMASVLKALAHPARLFIVEELKNGERCVCELQRMIGTDMSTVSKHLSVLRNVGLVEDDKRGNQVFYSLRVPCVLGFLECTESVLRENVKKQLEAIR